MMDVDVKYEEGKLHDSLYNWNANNWFKLSSFYIAKSLKTLNFILTFRNLEFGYIFGKFPF